MLFLLLLYIWNFSNIVMCFYFLFALIISVASVMGPCLCPVLNMWFEYLKLLLLLAIGYMCSLYQVWNALPGCAM
jgi:hypothetical protein